MEALPDVASPFLPVPAAYRGGYPNARWMFLTLTVRNCAIEELGETLSRMNTAFQRLKDRKEFRPVQGWIRTTEVTRGSDGSAHPHFHTLMMVPPSMLSGVITSSMGAGLNCGGSACGSATIRMSMSGSKTPEAEGRRIAGLRDRRTGARRGGRDPEIFHEAGRHGRRS